MSKKIEVKRQGIFVDMTAMCDMAFLLLTFFILTAKFRPNEPVVVDVPASRAQIALPESNIMLITVDTEGRAFMGIDNMDSRSAFLSRMGQKYGFVPTQEMDKAFRAIEQFGVHPSQLPQFLSLEGPERGKMKQPGIPLPANMATDTANVLRDMIYLARVAQKETTDEDLRIAIKSDKATNYDMVDKIIKTLVKSDINRFNLITNAKTGVTE